MTSQPLISVIIPAYNAEQWISQSVGSALRQSLANIEVIVVDDGSSDRTAEVAKATGDARVRVISQKSAGAASARNRGLGEARGELIQYLDADDILSDEKLELQMNALGTSPAGSVASCAWVRFSGEASHADVQSEPVWPVADPVEWLICSLAGGGMMQPAAWLTPRSVADAAGPWDESLTLHDDGEYFTRILLAARRNVFVEGAQVYYRDVEDSLSRRRSRSAVESALAVCKARAAHLLAERDDERVRRALATQYAQFAYEHRMVAPDLAAVALGAIDELGEGPYPRIGGPWFGLLSRTVGFRAALNLRHDLRGKTGEH